MWSHQARVSWEHRQSWGHRGRGAGDSGPSASFPHTPLHNSLSHTQSCTLPRLTSLGTNDQPNYGYTQQYTHTAMQNVSAVKHPTSLCSAPSHRSLYSQLKNSNAHIFKITALQLSVQHIKLGLGHHMTMCVCCSQGESIGLETGQPVLKLRFYLLLVLSPWANDLTCRSVSSRKWGCCYLGNMT